MTFNASRRSDGVRHTLCAAVIALAALCAPAASWAGALTCLTGTDPSVGFDPLQIAVARTQIDGACMCSSFDGSHGKDHGNYVKCTKGAIASLFSPLRPQCKATVKKYFATSTCGIPASEGVVPCIKKTTAGKVTCAIKPAAKCTGKPGKYDQAACPNATLCIDAADTNHDGVISTADSGACNSGATCANGGIPIGQPCGTCGDGICCGQGTSCNILDIPGELCDAAGHACISATSPTGFPCATDADCLGGKCAGIPTAAACGLFPGSACFAACAE